MAKCTLFLVGTSSHEVGSLALSSRDVIKCLYIPDSNRKLSKMNNRIRL